MLEHRPRRVQYCAIASLRNSILLPWVWAWYFSNDAFLCQVLKKLLTTSILASSINSNSTHLPFWVLLFHFHNILLELCWSLIIAFHKVDLGVSRVVVGKHNNISLAAHRLSLHWPYHIKVNQLKKSSLCLILWTQRLERLPEHLVHDACVTSACRWALSMQLDTSDCIREPLDSWQGEVAESSRPTKNILIMNRGLNVGIGLGEWSGPQCIIYCYRGFRDWGGACRCSEDQQNVDEWCFIDEDWSKTRRRSLKFKIKVNSILDWLDDTEEIIRATGLHIKDMLQDDLCGLCIWPVDVKHNGSRAFGIDKAVVCRFDLMLPLCHRVKGLKEVTIAGVVISCSCVKNPIIGRSICRCQIDHDDRVWRRVRDRVGIYDWEEEWLWLELGSRCWCGQSQVSITFRLLIRGPLMLTPALYLDMPFDSTSMAYDLALPIIALPIIALPLVTVSIPSPTFLLYKQCGIWNKTAGPV